LNDQDSDAQRQTAAIPSPVRPHDGATAVTLSSHLRPTAIAPTDRQTPMSPSVIRGRRRSQGQHRHSLNTAATSTITHRIVNSSTVDLTPSSPEPRALRRRNPVRTTGQLGPKRRRKEANVIDSIEEAEDIDEESIPSDKNDGSWLPSKNELKNIRNQDTRQTAERLQSLRSSRTRISGAVIPVSQTQSAPNITKVYGKMDDSLDRDSDDEDDEDEDKQTPVNPISARGPEPGQGRKSLKPLLAEAQKLNPMHLLPEDRLPSSRLPKKHDSIRQESRNKN
jgi:hypothetical protein